MTEIYYSQLEDLHNEYGLKGLNIMAFQSSEFGQTENIDGCPTRPRYIVNSK